MRHVKKQRPPIDVAPDGQPTRSFRKARAEFLADLPTAANPAAFARTGFDQLDKRKLRAVLYREQRHLCVYCESPLTEGHPSPRIDHWRPVEANAEIALDWNNLYLSCPNPETCDASKDNQPLKWLPTDNDLPWPADFAYEAVLGFTSFGEIYVRGDVTLVEATRRALALAIHDQTDGNRTRKAILNLNHPALRAARRAAIDAERQRLNNDFRGQTATPSEREQRAQSLLRRHQFPEFISIRVCWLRKTLGKCQVLS